MVLIWPVTGSLPRNASKVLDTVLIVVLIVLVHHLADAFADTLNNPESLVADKLRGTIGVGDKGLSRFALFVRTSADVLLVIVGVPWLMALWTVTWVDFRSLINSASVGFKLGNVSGSAACGVCHREYPEWQADAHSKSAISASA